MSSASFSGLFRLSSDLVLGMFSRSSASNSSNVICLALTSDLDFRQRDDVYMCVTFNKLVQTSSLMYKYRH